MRQVHEVQIFKQGLLVVGLLLQELVVPLSSEGAALGLPEGLLLRPLGLPLCQDELVHIHHILPAPHNL